MILAALVLALASTAATAGDLARGARLYDAWCLDCHGPAQAPVNATSLNARHSVPVLREGIANARSGMLFLGDVLNASDLSDIAAFLGTTPATVDFGTVPADAPPDVRRVVLRAGRDGVDGLTVAVQGDFVRTGGSCDRAVAAGEACTIDLAFRPEGTGERQGVLLIGHSGLVATARVPLVAVAARPAAARPAAMLVLDAAAVDFGRQTVGRVSAPRTVIATNAGDVPLAWLSRIPPTGFTVDDDCGASLAPGARCRLTVRFAPLTAGPAGGDLVLVTSQAGGDLRLPLTGTGVPQAARLRWETDTRVAAAPTTAVGRSSPLPSLTLRNDGPGGTRLEAIRITGPQAGEFTLDDGAVCREGLTLEAGAGCTLPLVFTPRATGTRTATLAIGTTGEAPPDLALAGAASDPPPTPSATNLGGGGCTIGRGRGPADPIWALMTAGAITVLVLRGRGTRTLRRRREAA